MCEICTDYASVQQQYAEAHAALLVLGPDHDPHDYCDCDLCDRERELYFIKRHFLDGVGDWNLACERLRKDPASPVLERSGATGDPPDELTDDELPF